ncbi:hypothetical protein J437_LFUL000793 [Ladona fulva]|uniref:Ion transport domain-containing protein n=1 Tax=Ladona fulva TaxID=123851 RepID=A0A8K0PD16_LADFU|nr:hypothetical protein J437_LFUL000793 [Ladona fulva]
MARVERSRAPLYLSYNSYSSGDCKEERRWSRVALSVKMAWPPHEVAHSLRCLPGGDELWDALEAEKELGEGEDLVRNGDEEKQIKCVEAAIAKGYGETALLLCAWCAHSELIEKLLNEHGINANATDDEGRSALHLACCAGDEASVDLLLRHGAKVDAWDRSYRATPIHCAAFADSVACIEVLLEAGTDVNTGLSEGYTPLYYAVVINAIECVKTLLKAGANPNILDGFTQPPLHLAASYGFSECLRVLLEAGADVKARYGVSNDTALHMAAQDGNAECVNLLLQAGADDSALNHKQQRPMHLASLAQSTDTIELLLSRGAAVNVRDEYRRTPLHCAIVRGSRCTDCVKLFISEGADVNSADAFGYTPLHLAALNEFPNCVGLLINAGADVMARTNGGVSALTFVIRRTPESLPCFFERLDSSITLHDHDLGDADCELRFDFRTLLPPPGRVSETLESTRVESALLMGFIEVGMRHLLKHPLCETFLFLKWQRIRRYFLISLAFQLIFVIFDTAYTIGVFSQSPKRFLLSGSQEKMLSNTSNLPYTDRQTYASSFPYINNFSIPGNFSLVNNLSLANGMSDASNRTDVILTGKVKEEFIIIGYILFALNLIFLAKEIFGIAHGWVQYITNWENWLKLLIVISVFACYGSGHYEYASITMAQHHIAAIGIVLAWAYLMVIIGRFPTFGVYIQMFTTVAINFSKFLFAYCCLLVGFGLALGVLLPNFPSFEYPYLSLLKSFIMMSGELEYEDIFFDDNNRVLYSGTSHILFLIFVILVTVILTNLLVGLAVSDIQGLQKTARLNRLVRQTELVAHIESILFSKILHKIVPSAFLVPYSRNALMMTSTPYSRFLHIRPNDPREKRVPRHLMEGAYNLVASRSGKKPKMGETGPGSRKAAYRTWAMQYSLRSRGISDDEEIDDDANIGAQIPVTEFISSQMSLLATEAEARETFVEELRAQMADMRRSMEVLSEMVVSQRPDGRISKPEKKKRDPHRLVVEMLSVAHCIEALAEASNIPVRKGNVL